MSAKTRIALGKPGTEMKSRVVAISLNLFRNGAVGFIDWLDEWKLHNVRSNEHRKRCDQKNQRSNRQKNKSKPARAYYEIS